MDILHTPTNAKGKGKQNSGKKNKEIIVREIITGTPFTAVYTKETKWIGVCGKYRITQSHDTKEELEAEVNTKSWDLIMTVINIVITEGAGLRKEQISNN